MVRWRKLSWALIIVGMFAVVSLLRGGKAVASCPPVFVGDYVIVCEDAYRSLMSSYVGFYSNVEGLIVRVVSLSEVRACYGALPDSSAIRAYLKACWQSSSGRLKYVLLVGRSVAPFYFEPTIAELATWDDSIPYDDGYGSFSEFGVCDLAVGRLPFENVDEVGDYMGKVVELAGADPSEGWRRRALILCEDLDMQGGISGAYAHALAESLSACCIPEDWDQTKLFLYDLPWWDLVSVQNDYVLPEFNSGQNLVVALGTYSSPFDMVDCISTQYAGFGQSQLNNYGKYPLVLGSSCEIGEWDVPDQYGGKVGNLLLSAPGTGAIALVAPTSTTLQNCSYWFTRELLEAALFDGDCVRWGDAFRKAKNAMVERYPFAWDVWREYSFFGDPTVSLQAYAVGVRDSVPVGEAVAACVVGCYPNPFNPSVDIKFRLSEPGTVSLRIYDVAGRMVRSLPEKQLDCGRHTVRWDGSDENGRPCASGIYFYRLESPGVVLQGKLALVK